MSHEIETYLDQLAERLQPGGFRTRRVLAETEDHLRQSAEALAAQGLDEDAATTEAIARFGPPELIAARLRPTKAALGLDVLRAGWLLSALGMVAIGLSGLVAELIFDTAGATFLAGDGLGVTYTPARCADFLRFFPDAGSCASAAAMHHSGEVVIYRVAAGVLGVLMLAAYYVYRRRWGSNRERVLPSVAVPLISAATFAAAGVALLVDALGLWVGQATHGETLAGVGDPLSAGIVAALAAALAALVATRRLVSPRSGTPTPG